MKTSMILLILTLTLSSCINKTKPLNQLQIDSMTKELNSKVDLMFLMWKTKDVSTAFSSFSNSTDFTFIACDGTIMDYSAFIKMRKYMFDSSKDLIFELLDKKIKIIKSDMAIALANYKCEIYYKNSAIENHPKVGAAFVFNKINDTWIVTHFQESYLTPRIMKPPESILIESK